MTGDPVNDETVAKQIRNGSPQMPAFGTALKDADIADLLAYLHNGCCYEETNPPKNPWYRATAQNSPAMPERGNLRGGPKGVVRSAGGEPLEGIMVQLIAPNAVRTTVTTDEDGQYEFPQLLPGAYTLRIARPLEFLPYQRDAVRVDNGAQLDDIVLQRRIRERLPAAHRRCAGAALRRRVAVESARHRRGEADLQPHLRGRLPRLRSDHAQQARRAQLAADAVPHAALQRLAADRARPPARQPRTKRR